MFPDLLRVGNPEVKNHSILYASVAGQKKYKFNPPD